MSAVSSSLRLLSEATSVGVVVEATSVLAAAEVEAASAVTEESGVMGAVRSVAEAVQVAEVGEAAREGSEAAWRAGLAAEGVAVAWAMEATERPKAHLDQPPRSCWF